MVFPTPPYWLARAMKRRGARSVNAGTADLTQAEDGGLGVRAALEPLRGEVPVCGRARQLLLGGAAFRQDRDTARGEQTRRESKQHIERRQGARGDGRDQRQPCHFDPLRMHPHARQLQSGGRFRQEGGLAAIRFDQMHLTVGPRGGNDESRQSSARSQIGYRPFGRQQRYQLQAVGNVPSIHLRPGLAGDKVDGRVPAQEQVTEGHEPTVAYRVRRQCPNGLFHVKRTPSRRRATAKAAMAAGVMPGSLPAEPSVAGRAAVNR